ncbi:TonB-dependent receptor [Novosphingobium humi]|uniref:TonB-dependent receptor n=1 Tax=Novosphingobium humi TaxID=2282397 RepID=UPI0025B033FA|nr:TonB-dependent receptor [Novosphingobium humi]WJT01018.1 TonB-dependent receptor [Novosphingobium humi]
MTNHRQSLKRDLILGSAMAILFATSAQAADNTPAAPATDTGAAPMAGEIVVTAQKRQQSLRDVPLSIAALGADDMKAVGHQDATGLVTRLPSFQVQQFSPSSVIFNIRGVSQNDFADSQEAPIAFYNDEVYGAALSAISGQNFDLERIEVLRGPQGTLFGRNATGGLVQYITAKPTKKLEAAASLTLGDYGEVGVDAFISGPLSDRVRARLAVTSDDYGGYIQNLSGPNVGSRHFFGARAQIEGDVGASGLLRVKVQYLQNRSETSAPYTWLAAQPNADGLGVPNPGQPDNLGYINTNPSPFVQSFNNVPRFRRTFWSVTARYEQPLGDNIQFVSITDYQHVTKHYGEDTDMTPQSVFDYYQDQTQWQASQEFRLSGKTDRLNWVAGIYGLVIDADARATIDGQIPGFLVGRMQAGGPQKTLSFAPFGQFDYKVTDKLTLTLGGRYSWDRKKDDYFHSVVGDYGYTTGVVTLNGVDDRFNPANNPLAVQYYRNWSGKVGLEYRPMKDMLFYAGINRGTKSGGFDIPNFLIQDANGNYLNNTIPYRQEVLTNYEGGFKISALNRKLDVNASVFHYKYSNYQAFIIQGLTAVITNLPAQITGAEMEVAVRPISGMRLGAFATYLDTKINNVALPSGRVTDRVMPQAPTWSAGWNASYSFALGKGDVNLSTDWRYDGDFYFSTFNAPIDLEKSHVMGNARIGYTLGHWSITAFVNNVTNKRFRVYDLDNSLSLGSAQATFARPRWMGVTFGWKM